MKVSDVGKVNKEMRSAAVVQDKPTAFSMGSSFRRQMSDLSKEQYQDYIEDLKECIFVQGEEIKKTADISGFIKYRKLIAELVGEVAGSAYCASRYATFDGSGRHKVMVTIKRMNVKLDEMAQQILSEQSDSLKLIQMVDDIRGMIVDLLL